MKPIPIPLIALVIDQEKRTTRNGDFFWQVILKTRLGHIKAIMWKCLQNAEKSPRYPHVEDIIEITGFEDHIAERGNIVINTFNRITSNDVPIEDHFILEIESASEEELNFAENTIRDHSIWEDQKHYQFVMLCLEENWENFRKSPAATKVHHAYQGGLLVHTAELLQLCKMYVATCYERYSFINKDVLYAGAILHDLGKIKTYSFNGLGVAKFLKTENTIGHIFYAMNIVKDCSQKFGLNDSDFVDEVLHCIAAHHGTREWGSIVEPQSLEAGIISRFDYISSRNGMMEKVLKESIQSGQAVLDTFKLYGDEYFASTGIRSYIAQIGQ